MFIVGKCRLNEILKARKMTQVDLALQLGMKKQQVHAYANNTSTMTLKTAKNIAHHLDVPVEELYDFIWVDQ
ncbi:helix-turn-helix transcriptional regulator [Bacillus sp. SH5-2]|uniref:helix-turn-helix transcriptional regulator n=1 Tax=Bacillus sp. SH5-2 TaxID=2217834 RepID=UPI0011EFAA33|nr:helix-turn-helix transcriptional regulator [Bacillus sp. SH5-2]KAA0762969.1 XRE family transcriptional regulator [Bacillus sp. SH5-2]